jgi:hypothetical protein
LKKIQKAVGFAISGGGVAVALSHLAMAYAG